MGMKERIWREWDAALQAGRLPQDVMAGLPEDRLLALIATAGPEREHDARLFRTEALRRLTTARREASPRPDAETRRVREMLDIAAEEVHGEEAAVEARVRAEGRAPPTPETDLVHAASEEIEIARAGVEDHVEAKHTLNHVPREPGHNGDEDSPR